MRDIGLNADGAATHGADAVQHLLPGLRIIAPADRDIPAALGREKGDRASDAARPARNHH
ncbi:hypothetical protein D3C76_1707640 [compost metagenome]